MGITNNNPLTSSKDHQLSWIGYVESIIISSLDDPGLCIAKLAKMTGLSERQFHRRVKTMLNLTPHKFIQSCRMDAAKKILDEGKILELSAISKAIGYKRVDYFSKLFHTYYGVYPIDLLKTK